MLPPIDGKERCRSRRTMRRELYRVWIISHCCSKVSHKPTSRCFVLITMQVEAFLSNLRTNRVFRSCFVHVFQTTTLGTGTFVVVLTRNATRRQFKQRNHHKGACPQCGGVVVRGRADGSRRGLCGLRWQRGRRRGHRPRTAWPSTARSRR